MIEITVPQRNAKYFIGVGSRNILHNTFGKGSSIDPILPFNSLWHYFYELDNALKGKEISVFGAHIAGVLGLSIIPSAAISSFKSVIGLADLGFDMTGKNDFNSQ